ncbi:hypothetical protein ACQ86O_01460 [Serratia sp. L9]|uniref:hypothetical protein n=1 Tax=Serratia sp. L9 TaxID=3423946 RepID=UPI003D67AA74
MVEALRNPLLGLMCLSMVGCANMSDNDFAAASMIVVGVGALVALALINDSGDEEQKDRNSKNPHKHNASHEHGKDHRARR